MSHVCPTTSIHEPTVAILGLGLMGGSLAAALKRAEACAHLIGYDPNPDHAAYCQTQKWVHAIAQTPEHAVQAADIVVLCAPIGKLEALAHTIAPHLREGAIITDIASAKEQVTNQLRTALPDHAHLVPAHPIAGKSEHGPEAAHANLFEGKLTIITADRDVTPDHALAAVNRLWESVGAQTERMAAVNHDVIYAYASHLPQMMAYAACAALAAHAHPTHAPEAFTRFIRLGGSDPRIWQDIALFNAERLHHALSHVLATIEHMIKEFAEGTAEGHESKPSADTATRFFPMLACASLISALTQFEMQNQLRLQPYAGTGLADFIAPADDDPEKVMEAISESYTQVHALLQDFHQNLTQLAKALKARDGEALLIEMQRGHEGFRQLTMVESA